MTTKRHNKMSGTGTRKSRSNSLFDFQKEISVKFLEMLLTLKLFHWKTTNYSTHKATDELYGKLNENMDEFIEVLLGKSGKRIDLVKHKNIKLIDLTSQKALESEVNKFKYYLVGLDNNKALKSMTNTDLYSIRDTILANMNQFLYLLSFKH